MAAGIVYHDITTAAGVTFSLACWVPDTASPDVGAIPVSLPIKSDGSVADMTLVQAYLSRLLSGELPIGGGAASATTGQAVGGSYNATPLALTDTQQAELQLNADGSLKTKGTQAIDQTTPGSTDRVTVGNITYIDVTLSTPAAALDAGDVAADTQIVAAAFRANDFGGVLQSLTLIDKDDQGAALDIYLLSANVSMGTENAAPSISDANAAAIMGPPISIATGDYFDLGGVKVAGKDAIGKALMPASGTDDFYVAVVNGAGTPTYTASGLVLRFGIMQD